jgi:hypothetical protein
MKCHVTYDRTQKAFAAINKHSHVIELDCMSLHAIKFSRSEIQMFQLKMGFKNLHMSVMSQKRILIVSLWCQKWGKAMENL